MIGAEFWGVAWAMIAAVAGLGLAAAAIAGIVFRRANDVHELEVGYNALAPFLDL